MVNEELRKENQELKKENQELKNRIEELERLVMGVMEKNPRNTRKPRKTRETKPSTTQPKAETAEDHVQRWEPELATRNPPNQNNEENDEDEIPNLDLNHLYEEIATEVSTTDIKTQSSRPKRRTAGSICRYVSGTTRPKKKTKPSKNTRVKKSHLEMCSKI